MKEHIHSFNSTFFGYNKQAVDDYVKFLIEELKVSKEEKENLENQIDKMRDAYQNLDAQIVRKEKENSELNEKICDLENEIRDLEKEVIKSKDELLLQSKNHEKLEEKYQEEEIDRITIQNAILNAQRMGNQIIKEANESAEKIINDVNEERTQIENESQQILNEAKLDADRMIHQAQLKCEDLNKEYDDMLMDVTKFKKKLLLMYKGHMENLMKLPEKTEQIVDVIDVVDGV